MPTILHAADVHLDRAYSAAGMTSSIASTRRHELRDAFRRLIDIALELRADAITIAGDLYEHDRATLDTAGFLQSQFARLGSVPVLIAPGNHDPMVPDSLYRRCEWPANVTIFDEPHFKPVPLAPGLTIWGAAHTAPDMRENLLQAFRVPAGGDHLLLFHGSDLASVPEGKRVHCGFRAEDIAHSGAAYALLGHYHGPRITECFAYPGSLEPLDFSEAGEHGAVLLDIEGAGVAPRFLPLSRVRYGTSSIDVTGMTSSEDLRSAIVALGDSTVIMRIMLEGALDPAVDLDVRALYNACAERFQFLDIVPRTRPAWRFDELAEESTTKGAFVRLMLERIQSRAGEQAETELALSLGLQAFERREVCIQ